MSRFAKIFAARGARPALIPYLTAGDPSLAASRDICLALAQAGADIIELGVPFSDPVADGPVIQAASQRALAHGTRLADVLELARAVRCESEVGLLLFSYYNPILRYGLERFARDAAAAGCDGVLVTDLIPEEAAAYRAAVQAAGLDTIFLAAPTSPDARLAAIAAASSGFIYAVARLGVTGAASEVAGAPREMIQRLRRHTKLPIALGFGLARADQVRAAGEYADGTVVGSALVAAIAAAAPGGEATAAAGFLRSLQP
ncbi:MAG TPA: tryptophan synthase subunit alpha [Terriglobales bacterium]|nr:tryptophan synthase subunit alpha [Terriglobales bacterium]